MKKLVLLLGLTAIQAPLATAAPAPTTPLVQDEDPDEKPDKREDIAEACDKVKAHAKKRGDEDQLAIEAIDGLLQEFPDCGPKDRVLIVKTLESNFKQKRKPSKEGLRDNKLHRASAVALGRMGPESAPVLLAWIEKKPIHTDWEVQEDLILGVGRTKSAKAHKKLIDLLTHHKPRMQKAAAEAMGNYVDSDQKVRKEFFSKIMKELINTYDAMDADPQDLVTRERYDVIAASMINTMQALTGHDERVPDKWQRWWNKNKKADWDKEG